MTSAINFWFWHFGAGGSVDIQGVCKSTVVRGEDNFPAGILRVTDCHDTVVYALAPLHYAKIAACSDCTVRLLQNQPCLQHACRFQ